MGELVYSDTAKNLPLGNYRHYKGGEYEVLFVGRHSETLEELVIYQDRNNRELVWARPLSMFIENEGDQPRFAKED
tara:strand:- start:1852 stop:2079 length:228 start_codon:yes stop_codon:yes gene_type:complete